MKIFEGTSNQQYWERILETSLSFASNNFKKPTTLMVTKKSGNNKDMLTYRRFFSLKDRNLDIQSMKRFINNDGTIYKIDFNNESVKLDIDIDDYDRLSNKNGIERLRICCKGKKLCFRCYYVFIRTAIIFLDTMIRETLGYDNLLYVFSGRKGIHIHINDNDVYMKTDSLSKSFLERYFNECLVCYIYIYISLYFV